MRRIGVRLTLLFLWLTLGCTNRDRAPESAAVWHLVDWPSVEASPAPLFYPHPQAVELGPVPPPPTGEPARAVINDNRRYTFTKPKFTFLHHDEHFSLPLDQQFAVDVGLPGELRHCEELIAEITTTSGTTSVAQRIAGRCTGERGAEHLHVDVPTPATLRGKTVDFWVHARRPTSQGIRQRRFTIPAVPAGSKLKFAYGVESAGWAPDASAALFHVLIEDQGKPLFSARLDPALNESQRRWFEASVDLSRFAGKRLPLILQTALDRADDRRPFSRPVWGNPRILVPRSAQSPPNVLLITIDTLRADRLHCYGYERGRTPNIDRLAAEGARFTNAFADVTWTVPSLISTMTGEYAVTHGVRSTYQRLDSEHQTLATMLRGRGRLSRYTTGAIVGSFPASSMFGFGRGFDLFDEHFNTPIVTNGETAGTTAQLDFHDDIEQQKLVQLVAAENNGYRPDSQVTDAALEWVRARHAEPFFLWVHYFGPHEKSDKAKPFFDDVNDSIAAYDGDVETSDREVGRLIEALRAMDVLDSTIVILHADHGQSLNEHDYFGHGQYLYDEVLRVPLVIRFPAIVPAGRTVAELARNVDITPTVLALTRSTTDSVIQGKSLLPSIRGDRSPHDDELYSETYLSATRAFATQVPVDEWYKPLGFRRLGLRTGPWMFIRNEPWPFIDDPNPQPVDPALEARFTSDELYNVVEDPRQGDNRASAEPGVMERARTRLASYLAAERQPASYRPLDKASLDRLRSLGYVQ